MPSFYPNQFPPTPPEYKAALAVTSRMTTDQPFYSGHSGFPARYGHNTGCDFIEQYAQSNTYGPMSVHSQSMQSLHYSGRDPSFVQPVVAQPPSRSVYNNSLVAAPILPPIRPQEQITDDAVPPQYRRQETHVHHEPQAKEEKATGGVAAHLDYDMDQMSNFVAEMAQGMYAIYISEIYFADTSIDLMESVLPGTAVPPQFRKYVSQILSSTRLPSSTILLGLFYLASRIRILSTAGVFNKESGSVYRMLTTSLLLGSKFLDDNTFQNRSWAEVSNISVAELNTMELEWLMGFGWKIHNRLYAQDGFASWQGNWEKYCAKTAAKASEGHKLTPIDTSIRRRRSLNKAILSPEGPIPPQYQRTSHYGEMWIHPANSEYSPPSAPHTGPNTPEYYTGSWSYANPPPPYSVNKTWVPPAQPYIPQPPQRSQPPSYHHTPSHTQQYSHSVWTGHGSSCGCMYCNSQEHYFSAPTAYGMQPVAG